MPRASTFIYLRVFAAVRVCGRSAVCVCVWAVYCLWLLVFAWHSISHENALLATEFSTALRAQERPDSAVALWSCKDLHTAYATNGQKLMRISSGGNKDVLLGVWKHNEIAIKRFRWLSWAAVLHPLSSYHNFKRELLLVAGLGGRIAEPEGSSSGSSSSTILTFAGACIDTFNLAFATQRCSLTLSKVFPHPPSPRKQRQPRGNRGVHRPKIATTYRDRVTIVVNIAAALVELRQLAKDDISVLCDFHMNQFMFCPPHFSSSSDAGTETKNKNGIIISPPRAQASISLLAHPIKAVDLDSFQVSEVAHNSACVSHADCHGCSPTSTQSVRAEWQRLAEQASLHPVLYNGTQGPAELSCLNRRCTRIGPEIDTYRWADIAQQLLLPVPAYWNVTCTATFAQKLADLLAACLKQRPQERLPIAVALLRLQQLKRELCS